MKLLRNPAVVVVLAVVGVGIMAVNIGAPIYKKHARQVAMLAAQRLAAAKPEIAAAVLASSTPAPAPADAGAKSAASQIDKAHFVARMENWTEIPPTDPFTLPAAPAPEVPKGPTAAQVLKLQGTWRQTGGFVAVIDKLAVIEGEPVEGFVVSRIEADRVVVNGPHGVEEIFFAGDPATAPLGAMPKGNQQASLTIKP